ncbi:hypothetical protein [Oscillatoria salina]|nr:hypothetical protein [Oscillatoria salina]MBZ8180502.1 hypothetical protein [Oscillatoria salina IIICB1]NET91423.1 hypothetical protein [Kamptonema sp. SIO1D9]
MSVFCFASQDLCDRTQSFDNSLQKAAIASVEQTAIACLIHYFKNAC